MRPWMQESRLAPHLLAQRSINRARTPVTPTFNSSNSPSQHMRPEDLVHLDRVTAALHELRARLIGGLGNRQLVHRFVEIQKRRGGHPVGAEAEIDFIEIELENLLLGRESGSCCGTPLAGSAWQVATKPGRPRRGWR